MKCLELHFNTYFCTFTYIFFSHLGHDIFQSGSESGSMRLDLTKMGPSGQAMYKSGVFSVLITGEWSVIMGEVFVCLFVCDPRHGA